ncbi:MULTISPECIES: WxL domain-containing protein [Enterococcus]|uniref:WxL domain-containing protein n=2 Tax=Enterococcus TaxID=1350 RepID=R3WQ66_9ENTE|nr:MULTISPECIES: WxL domain-containing protein [Enterococcus]EOL43960.1 hypothetical protein UC7_02533 [Enterococcus caccae ATCC BAA-1240]EOT68395.1 hypothetical protein I580_00778 [Enterococcus caccae ATCC BAA-1240]MBO0441861.1 WxL domain-containing protein [Enterococcus sp. DIV0869a]OJG22062.1 hypothetical protein RU98_GL002266 [Enterococcus caccae]
MKKTTIASALLISTFILGAASPAFADQVAAPTTDATVKFKSEPQDADNDGNTIDPLDPDGNGVKPETGEGSVGTKGPLRVDFAPNFKFGTVTMSGNAAEYHPLYMKVNLLDETGKVAEPLQSKYVPHYVQVTDNRGTNDGWELTVAATPFKGTVVDKNADLKATLTLGHSQFTSPVKPVDGKDFKPATLNTNVTLTPEAKPLIVAKADQGMGSWAAVFSKDTTATLTDTDRNPNVTLSVPADSKKDANEEYKSTITWTLSTTPTTPPTGN